MGVSQNAGVLVVLSFVNHDRWVFMLIYAVKTNNGSLYHKCMAAMARLFFSQGGQTMHATWSGMALSSPTLKWAILVHLRCWTMEQSQLLVHWNQAAGGKLTKQCKRLSWNLQSLGEVSYTVYQPESMIKLIMSKHGNFMNNMTSMLTSKKKIRMPNAMQSSSNVFLLFLELLVRASLDSFRIT